MDTRTGEIASEEELKAKGVPEDCIKLIDLANLSPRIRKLVEETGHAVITRNTRCPCGSGKRFKRCCLTAV